MPVSNSIWNTFSVKISKTVLGLSVEWATRWKQCCYLIFLLVFPECKFNFDPLSGSKYWIVRAAKKTKQTNKRKNNQNNNNKTYTKKLLRSRNSITKILRGEKSSLLNHTILLGNNTALHSGELHKSNALLGIS